jgi:hypothetical protein
MLSRGRGSKAEAEEVVTQISEQYFSPKLTLDELRELARAAGVDPMRAYSDTCRIELNGLRRELRPVESTLSPGCRGGRAPRAADWREAYWDIDWPDQLIRCAP